MSSSLESLKIKAKLLQKAKKKSGVVLPLKDALETVAKLAGFSSWRDLKAVADETDLFCPPGTSAHWKTWWASYDDAKKDLALRGSGFFLLPYRRQFFICDADYIATLGIAKDDADLAHVGSNWAQPEDPEAWRRLRQKLRSFSTRSMTLKIKSI